MGLAKRWNWIIIGVWAVGVALLSQGQPAGATSLAAVSAECQAGFAAGYPCRNANLLAFLPLADVGGGQATDVAGWDDPETGYRYAILARTNGVALIDFTDASAPVYVAELPSHVGEGVRQIEIYGDYALIVADIVGHGMQVLDLKLLRSLGNPADLPVILPESGFYPGAGQAQNIVVNAETRYAYAVGMRGAGLTCSGGLHMINLANPLHPVFGGCFSADGFTHDAQCLVYRGPDHAYFRHELCFCSNEDSLTIVDMTNRSAPTIVSRSDFAGRVYIQQGWLTPNQRYFLVGDSGDELQHSAPTTTTILDVSDLDLPFVASQYVAATSAIDGSQFTRDRYAYQANHSAGLRLLRLTDDGDPGLILNEDAYFDVYPADDDPSLNGAWSVFPFFAEEGLVALSSYDEGLFIVRLTHIAFQPNAVHIRQIHATTQDGWLLLGTAGLTLSLGTAGLRRRRRAQGH